MQTLISNDRGGITYARPQLIGESEHRSEILADLRMTLDALADSCEYHQQARANIAKLMAMLADSPEANTLRAALTADLEKIDAIAHFNAYIIKRVRGGNWKHFSGLFDR